MSLIGLVIVLAVVGLLLWLVGQIPMDPTVKTILHVVVLVVLVLWLLQVFGLMTSLDTVRIGPHR